MKKPILLLALIPLQLVFIFFTIEQLTHSQKYAWRGVGTVVGISIVMGLAILLGKKLNKPN
jgi:hypothetical protein